MNINFLNAEGNIIFRQPHPPGHPVPQVEEVVRLPTVQQRQRVHEVNYDYTTEPFNIDVHVRPYRY